MTPEQIKSELIKEINRLRDENKKLLDNLCDEAREKERFMVEVEAAREVEQAVRSFSLAEDRAMTAREHRRLKEALARLDAARRKP